MPTAGSLSALTVALLGFMPGDEAVLRRSIAFKLQDFRGAWHQLDEVKDRKLVVLAFLGTGWPSSAHRKSSCSTRIAWCAIGGASTTSLESGFIVLLRHEKLLVDPKLKEDVWVRASQVRPGNPSVVHHLVVFVVPPGANGNEGKIDFLAAYAP
jgi:hypothetical protein